MAVINKLLKFRKKKQTNNFMEFLSVKYQQNFIDFNRNRPIASTSMTMSLFFKDKSTKPTICGSEITKLKQLLGKIF